MKTRLIWITPDTEKLVAYIARVSNPKNQENENIIGLLQYMVRHRHWSPFEHASACFEIETSRAIATQILRHRSFSFQEFSQRYADAGELGFEPIEIRKQSEKNRQSSTDVFDPLVPFPLVSFGFSQVNPQAATPASSLISMTIANSYQAYKKLIEAGVAKEQARFILPLATTTRLYMTGTLRSWMHYLDLRVQDDVQKEHRDVALSIRNELALQLPIIAEVAGWHQP